MTGATPVPVTLLTGFLGSGKTTVLNTLLRHPGFARTAVIVNEFGEIGLDHELVLCSTESMVLLQSGCMCCTLRGDLQETLIELTDRHQAGEIGFDRVVIETSGLADPAPILHTLLTDRQLAERYALDGIVTTVDAATGPHSLHTHQEARRQVALADLILLTKTDLPDAQGAATLQEISRLNPGAIAQTVTCGAVQPELLNALGHFDPRMKAGQARAWVSHGCPPDPLPVDASAAEHLSDIRTVSWVFDRPLSGRVFDIWMDLLMARRGQDILRFKGLIHLEDLPYPFAVHGVQHIFHPPVPLQDWQGDDRRTRLVMIVKDFADAELKDLHAALHAPLVVEHSMPPGYLADGMTS